MLRLALWALAACCTLGAVARGEEDFLSADALAQADLTKFWQARLPLDPGRSIVAAYLVDDAIYLGTDSGYVYAVHADTGVVRWFRPLFSERFSLRRPVHAAGRTIFLSASEIVQVDSRTGEGLARDSLDFPAGSAVLTDGRRLFLGGLDRRAYCFGLQALPELESHAISVSSEWLRDYNRKVRRGLLHLGGGDTMPPRALVTDGERYFVKGPNGQFGAVAVPGPVELWKFVTGSPIVSRPAQYMDEAGDVHYIFYASDNGGVYCCTATHKRFRWHNATYGAITADLVADRRGVFVACKDQSLWLLDVNFGEVRWRARFSGPLSEPPALTDDLIYQYCPDDGLVALDATETVVDERVRWRLPRGRALLTTDPLHSYVLSGDGAILKVDSATGKIAGEIPAPGFSFALPAERLNTIFVASADGRLFCARPKNVPYLRQEDIRAALMPTASRPAAETPETSAAAAAAAEAEAPKKGLPIGGKSKVTRDFEKGEGKP